jgi:DNA alkylation damage repair protein AlkB
MEAEPQSDGVRPPVRGLAETAFRREEKRYKLFRLDRRTAKRSHIPETDFSDVIDFRDVSRNSQGNMSLMQRVAGAPVECHTFSKVPGLLFFPNAIPPERQQYWAKTALLEFSQSALHPNNITTVDPTRTTTCYTRGMRWATLGLTYDWTNKTYTRSHHSPFPLRLAQEIASLMDGVKRVRQDQFEVVGEYQSQTAVVNYYPVGSMMMAHQDISEECLEKPLVSVSLGCSCIFLMGTESREDTPSAFLLRSGDVVAFTGPARTAFHSVPRILDDCPAHLTDGPEEWQQMMRSLRVNINVRQVFRERLPTSEKQDLFGDPNPPPSDP